MKLIPKESNMITEICDAISNLKSELAIELKTNGNTIKIIDGDNSYEILKAPDEDI